jgi:sugar/nucleoside kinase (ribokinase family)
MIDKVLDTAVLHIGGTGLMDRMDGAPTADLMRRAKERGVKTTLDVFAATTRDLPLVEGLLPYTDYFMPSIEEAEALSGLKDRDDVARFFIDRGVECCVLTLGHDGAYYHHRDGTRFEVPAFDIDVKCTCGCGDVFNAGFATGLHYGYDDETCVRIAQATSAQNATGLGSQAGVKDFETTLAFMKTTPLRRLASEGVALAAPGSR